MISYDPIEVKGNWKLGYALDVHVVEATYLGDNEYGHAQFDTMRSEIGELVYKLKNSDSRQGIKELTEVASTFIKKLGFNFDVIVPILPSKKRGFQPVPVLAAEIAKACNIDVAQPVKKIKETPQAKNIKDLTERLKVLEGAFVIEDSSLVRGKSVLLFDDLFGSGATLTVITELMLKAGANSVSVLTLTKTKTRNQ